MLAECLRQHSYFEMSTNFWNSDTWEHLFYLVGWCAKAFLSLTHTAWCYGKPKFPSIKLVLGRQDLEQEIPHIETGLE